MNFELLPNEILLNLFDYFNGIDLLHTFYGLNSRWNSLLYRQFRFYYFNFDELSKRNFDMICQQHLPFIADRVIALSLSDNQSTPDQPNLFFSYMSSFSQFVHLRSLSLFHVRSKQILMKIVVELHHLVNLTHLYFNSCYLRNHDQTDFELIVNNIWSLPSLTHCHFDIRMKPSQVFSGPSILSSSLEYLWLYGGTFKWSLINRLFQYTPHIKSLRVRIDSCNDNDDDNEYIKCSFPKLIDLSMTVFGMSYPSKVFSFLQRTPNLRRLNLSVGFGLIDGHQWENIIRNYLPKLKAFRFTMETLFDTNRFSEERIDELMNPFRSSFWIEEHRWFVRCVVQKSIIQLQTVTKTFYCPHGKLPDLFKSTYPQDDLEILYSNMTSIYDKTFFDQPISFNIRLSNIDYLSVKLPLNDQFWSIVTNLNRLKSLAIYLHTNISHSQFQEVLDQAPHLHKLIIYQDASLPWQMSLFKCTNASIRHLYLGGCKHYFNEEECITLSHSPLGTQCQLLNIGIKNRESIITLVKNMINLRALHIHCENENSSEHLSLTTNNKNILWKDEDIQWLKDRLPSTCLISRHPDSIDHIRIWLT